MRSSQDLFNILKIYESFGITEHIGINDIINNLNKSLLIVHNEPNVNQIEDFHNYSSPQPVINSEYIVPVTTKQKSIPAINPLPAIDFSFLNVINSLDDLKENLINFQGCDSLKERAMNTVMGSGNPNANIMLIGEAPGAEEDEQGIPFVGRSGKLLIKALSSIGILRENVYITNTVFWRPTGNRNPSQLEIDTCYPFVKKIIELVNPKIILLIGSIATKSIIEGNLPISQLIKKWYTIPIDNNNYAVRVLYHPAYLLRNPSQKKILWEELLEVKHKILEMNLKV